MPLRPLPVLLSFLIPWTVLISACSMMPPQTQTGLRAKPTTCLLPVSSHLSPLTAEFNANAEARNTLAQAAVPDRDRIEALDRRQVRILLDLKTADGIAYATAVTELEDCQAFINAQP